MKQVLIIMMLLPLVAGAQSTEKPGKTPEERAQRWTVWMMEEQIITVEQEQRVQEVNLKYARQAETLKGKQISRMTKFKELKTFDQAKDEELKQLLSEEQFKLYQEKKSARQRALLKEKRNS